MSQGQVSEDQASDGQAAPRLVVVVGASSDIGAAYMRLADTPNTTFIGQYRNSPAKVESLAAELSGEVLPVQADLAVPEQCEALADAILQQGVPHALLFVSAPPATTERFHKKGWGSFAAHIDVQLRGPITVLQRLIPKMGKRKSGDVVFVSSSYAMGIPPMGLSDYVTVKHALNGLVKALAAEYGRKGLRFNSVSPSMVETAYLESVPRITVEMSAENNPLKRNATPDDVAPLIEFLLSPAASYINGANVPVTAGSAM